MKTNEFFNKIAELSLHYKYGINSGGCGCFALLAIKHMPHLDIVFLDDGNNIQSVIDDVPTACSHVVLTDNENVYDAKGTHPMREIRNYRKHQVVSVEYLERSLDIEQGYGGGYWNNRFDRETLPAIEKEIAQIVIKNK